MANFPYRQAQLFYNEKTEQYTDIDDGVNWQWGDRYIRACETNEEVDALGGKYWRDNHNGTITEFTPHELIFAGFAKDNKSEIKRVDRKNWRVIFKSKEAADKAHRQFNYSFYSERGVKDVVCVGNKVMFFFSDEVYSRTYVPARNPD